MGTATVTPLSRPTTVPPAVVWFEDAGATDRTRVGGKSAALARVAREHRVPPGFTVVGDVGAEQLTAAYARLADQVGEDAPAVAVRSSAADEDGAEASFAGQHETILGVRGPEELLEAFAEARASGNAPRALAYRRDNGLAMPTTPLPVLVQALVAADSAAVVFSANPVTNRRDQVLVNASWGLGESIVGGTVTPDSFTVERCAMRVLERTIAEKRRMTVRVPGGSREVDVPAPLRRMPSIDDEQAIDAASLALALEQSFGHPVDLEVAWTGRELHLLQTRPITTLNQTPIKEAA